MVILLISDCPAQAAKLRQLLAQNGCACPAQNVLPIEAAASAVSCFYPKPDLVLFVLSEDRERSQKALEHLHQMVDVQIVAVGPRDPNLILGALHAGAATYLDESEDLRGELASVLRRIGSSESRQPSPGQLTTVIAASGGSGRTLLAANLAVALAKRHGRCGLLDMDLDGADVASYLNLRPRHSLADLCRKIDQLDQKMFAQSLADHESGVSVLAGPDNWEDHRYVTAESLQKVLRFGRTSFENLVADLRSFWLPAFAGVLQQSHAILLLVRLDFAATRNARRALTWLDRNGIDRGKVLLVAARQGRPKEIGTGQIESALGMRMRHFVPEDPHAANCCVNCGVPVLVEAPGSAFAKAVNAIAEAVAAAPPPEVHPQRAVQRNSVTIAEKVRSFLGMSLKELAHQTVS